MTEEESNRVNDLLENPDLDEEIFSETASLSTARPTTGITVGFYPEQDELVQLIEIDKKLQNLIPENEWETKSVVWSSVNPSAYPSAYPSAHPSGRPSGLATPATDSGWSRQSSLRGIHLADSS
jgi:hypothetical protein